MHILAAMTQDPIKAMRDLPAAQAPNHTLPLLRSRFHEEFPDKNAAQINFAIELAKLDAGPSAMQEEVEQLVRKHLSR